jgi:quercetin dioxygenase-like cupin family protein
MNLLAPRASARDAVSPNPARPATAILHDSPDLRVVVFRIGPGQEVVPHRSLSTVMLNVLSGTGVLTGEIGPVTETACAAGDAVTYAPSELHGMRAVDEELVVLATITPRPGSR